ncbi:MULTISPECIES: hypothetical protein [Vibrio]|jgi:hypothetical protein|nr:MULTISPECIES: hypothetical protein [Vibrio]MCG9631847.1 hypothetical protein [Vibrio sp. Isolate30]
MKDQDESLTAIRFDVARHCIKMTSHIARHFIPAKNNPSRYWGYKN